MPPPSDGDENWVDLSIPDLTFVTAIAINPENDSTLYISTEELGVYKTTDGGLILTPMNNGLGASLPRINALLIHPTQPEIIYAGTNNGVYFSMNGGELWTPHNTSLDSEQSRYVHDLARTLDGRILAATDRGLFYLDPGSQQPTTSTFVRSDINGDGIVNIADVTYSLRWQFLGGSEPPSPGPRDCGLDLTEENEELGCAIGSEGC